MAPVNFKTAVLEFLPHPALRRYITSYWTIHLPALQEPASTQFIANGCVEISFNLADPSNHRYENSQFVSSRAHIFGTASRFSLTRPSGRIRYFNIRFHPGGAAPFITIPAHELTNKCCTLDDAWGASGRVLTEQIRDSRLSDPDRCTLVDRFLLNRLEQRERRSHAFDLRLESAVESAIRHNGIITVDALAKQIDLSRRQLERTFKQKLGISPKQYCRILRFRKALNTTVPLPSKDWADIALSSGYYDQSHLIHEFRHFTGRSPTEYFNQRSESFIAGY